MKEDIDPLPIPSRGSRGAWQPPRFLMKALEPLMNMQISRYRKSASPTPPKMMGFPTVLLTTIGAKTGHERTHVLGGFADGDDAWLIIASKGGAATHPDWFINLAKQPDKVWLEVGNRKLRVRPQELEGAEREAAYAKVAAIAPQYGKYPKSTDREIPVIRLTPA
jgi:deazaflavin-dependent oxidoreductase (nitroreductase family)